MKKIQLIKLQNLLRDNASPPPTPLLLLGVRVALTVLDECLTLLKEWVTIVTHPTFEKCHGDFFSYFVRLYLKTLNVSGPGASKFSLGLNGFDTKHNRDFHLLQVSATGANIS